MTDQVQMMSQIEMIDRFLLPGTGEFLWGASENMLKHANVWAYIICIAANGYSAVFASNPLDKITDEWDIKIAPAGWAFSIWGLIYTLIGGFVFYQRKSGDVDSDVIYGQVGTIFGINMIANAVWLGLFQQDGAAWFGLSLIDSFVMLGSALVILNISTTNHLNNWWENVFFRGGFSIYAGWLTTATILNVAFFLKALGVDTGNTNIPNEVFWSKIILSVAFVIFNVYSYQARNPLYGAVFLWVLDAIKSNSVDKEIPELVNFIDLLFPLHIVSEVFNFMSLYWEFKHGTPTHGLFF